MNRLAVFMALLLSATGATAGIATLQATMGQVPDIPLPGQGSGHGNETEPPSNSTAGGDGNATSDPDGNGAGGGASSGSGSDGNRTSDGNETAGGDASCHHEAEPCDCHRECRALIYDDQQALGALSSVWEWEVTPDMHSLSVWVDVGSMSPAVSQDLHLALYNGAGQLVASGTRSGLTSTEWGTVLAYEAEPHHDGWSAGTWRLTMDSQLMVGSYSVAVMADCGEAS